MLPARIRVAPINMDMEHREIDRSTAVECSQMVAEALRVESSR